MNHNHVGREFKPFEVENNVFGSERRVFFLRKRGLRLFYSLFLVLSLGAPAHAQWKPLLSWGRFEFTVIYFIDLPGPPRIGFVASESDSGVYKTTDGGYTWRRLYLPNINWPMTFYDMTFKDTLTGWLTSVPYGCYKTTDGGETWRMLFPDSSDVYGYGIYFDKKSDGLFLSTSEVSNYNLISWDEGNTWLPNTKIDGLGYGGCAFANDDTGLLASADLYTPPWYRTSDAGKTWTTLSIDSPCWQPLAVPGTQTYYAYTYYGTFLRSTDMGNTWIVLHRFPWLTGDPYTLPDSGNAAHITSTCVRGDSNNLIIQNVEGCYRSTDQGLTWTFLCGPSWNYIHDGARFYVKGNLIYAATEGTVWMLNLDSLNIVSSNYAEQFPNGLKQSTIAVGDTVRVNYFSDSALGPQVGVDSVLLTISFDTSVLSLAHFLPAPGWSILDSSGSGGNYQLLLVTSDSLALDSSAQILSADFASYLSSTTQSKVYLDSVHFYGHRLNCDCEVQSVLAVDTSTHATAIDSVEVDFTGCGDSTLLAFMQGQPLFSIVSIQPNPASSELTVSLVCPTGAAVGYELYDALGTLHQNGNISANVSTLDVSTLPSGIYYLRFSSNGYAESRTIAIAR